MDGEAFHGLGGSLELASSAGEGWGIASPLITTASLVGVQHELALELSSVEIRTLVRAGAGWRLLGPGPEAGGTRWMPSPRARLDRVTTEHDDAAAPPPDLREEYAQLAEEVATHQVAYHQKDAPRRELT